ncbi:COP9 signalosome complex subunit 3-like isoform X1 [Homarus americanus]|uniref:COP9 signalosome complex subunit 3-like isoform X1 n=2 Tax=Homarus americanus TaxID=6706 RepID=UPI001C461EE0|nr:COP9 signalosome complex subunit 3-like isoform X1 [Homarus americanus]
MASALEHFVNNVTSLSSQGNYGEVVKYVSKSTEVLAKNVAHLDTVLATLQPQSHSLGVMAVLCVRLQNTTHNDANIDTLHATVAEFINVCAEEQIKYAPDMMADLCGSYADLLVAGSCAMRGIEVVSSAIRKTQESPLHLTSIHAHLVHLCLVSKCFKPALKFMDVDIMDISKERGSYDVKHFLLYYYYGGMIYTAIKNYDRAQYFFRVCISTPALAVSHIMLEAFKKYILVSLILEGKIGRIPKYASLVVTRFIKPLSQVYWDLGTAFGTNCPDKVCSVINKNQETFGRDQNMGLVKQCLSALYKKNIQRLTRTFLTLSLADVANRVQLSTPQEAQKYILNMIDDGEIHASINQRDGMVVFLDNPEKYNSPTMMAHLDKEMQLCMEVERRLQAMEEEIVVNPQYVQKVLGPQDDEGPTPSSAQSTSFSIVSSM